MAKLREGDPWIPGFRYGALLPPFSLNLLVTDTERSCEFYRAVFDAEIHYRDIDFAALRLGPAEVMLHLKRAMPPQTSPRSVVATSASERPSLVTSSAPAEAPSGVVGDRGRTRDDEGSDRNMGWGPFRRPTRAAVIW